MEAKKLFFCLRATHPHWPRFKAKIILYSVRANQASEDH